MKRGPKPKPTAVKERLGNPGRRPLGESEPRLEAKLPPCPDYLEGEARKEWYRTGRLLAAMRVLTEADKTALAAYCTVFARWREAESMLAKPGITLIIKTTNGNAIQNPYLGVANT